MNKQERIARLYNRLVNAGFSFDEAATLRRIEMTLSRWSEHECNGNIQRDEKTGVPYWYNTNARYLDPNDPRYYSRVADRERGALKRLNRIMESHPDYIAYHQGDPRGCALYLCRRSDTPLPIGANYSRGIAVCE